MIWPRQPVKNVVAQLRRGNRRPRRATQPLVLPRLSAISAPCTSAGRVQKRRGRVKLAGDPDFRIHVSDRLLEIHDGPFLELGLKGIAGQVIQLPRRNEVGQTSTGWLSGSSNSRNLHSKLNGLAGYERGRSDQTKADAWVPSTPSRQCTHVEGSFAVATSVRRNSKLAGT
jgi:hypothetical protein